MAAHALILEALPVGLAAGASAAAVLTGLLLLKSLKDFSKTGPELRDEVRVHYRGYIALATLRLGAWALVIAFVLTLPGILAYLCVALVSGRVPSFAVGAAFGTLSLLLLTGYQFCRHLLYLPAGIAASYHYRQSRLFRLWQLLTPGRLRLAGGLLLVLGVAGALLVGFALAPRGNDPIALAAASIAAAFVAVASGGAAALLQRRPRAPRAPSATCGARPNILMIGSDTLRVDRLGASRYRRPLTPFIDALGEHGTCFTSCYVPCARTAPSLISFFTGMWPGTHGIRDNFVSNAETRLAADPLPAVLRRHGYRTAAVSDWSGGDLGKFNLGFDLLDLPEDQWNLKYLLRQGPKDLRLFLSLFTHNRFGKWALPELYYLAGVPLTSRVGRDARKMITNFARAGEPFFLNVFMSTTHPPFGSEYPYYTLWSGRDYAGESKFVMARLTDPWEIIRRQADSRSEFELDQVIDLYDGCVRNFDDEVRRIVEHLDVCGLRNDTIVVIYSDHGMEFFEHDTWGQGNSVRAEASPRIPLVLFDPRHPGSGVCEKVVRSIDVMPTLLDLAGTALPSRVEGVSLRSYLSHGGPDLNLAAFNETGIWLTTPPGMPADHLRYPGLLEILEIPDKRTGTLAIKPEFKVAVIAAKDRMIRVGPWKLTYEPTTSGGRYMLFNVLDDPDCRSDLLAAHPETVADLKCRLHVWMNQPIYSRARPG